MNSNRRGRLLSTTRTVAINLVILAALFEITSVAAYFFRAGELFYTRSNARIEALIASFETNQPSSIENSLPFQLHPYFGYVSYSNPPSNGLNSSGFESKYQYPFKKTRKDQFVIGVFGGSVAYNFMSHEVATHAVEAALKRVPYFQDKEIVFLSFAIGAYKQPQQLLVLSYFLSVGQEFDMVVNIDGFNELALSYLNNKSGLGLSMPAGTRVLALADLANKDFRSETLLRTLELLQARNQVKDTLAQQRDCRFASCYTLRWIKFRFLLSRYQERAAALSSAKSNTKESSSLVHLDMNSGALPDSQVIEQSADVWAHSSLMMSELLVARNIPYFHVIQPNQYYPTGRQFSAEERHIAIDENRHFKVGVEKGYREILVRAERLKASGVKVFDGTTAFDHVEGTVYADLCCHYNKLGEDVFAKYVFDSIAASHPGPSTQTK